MKRRGRLSRKGRVRRKLQEAAGRPVPGYELAEEGGLQWQTRVWELRHDDGLNIRCDLEIVDGEVHSTYTLEPSKGQAQLFEPAELQVAEKREHAYPF